MKFLQSDRKAYKYHLKGKAPIILNQHTKKEQKQFFLLVSLSALPKAKWDKAHKLNLKRLQLFFKVCGTSRHSIKKLINSQLDSLLKDAEAANFKDYVSKKNKGGLKCQT